MTPMIRRPIDSLTSKLSTALYSVADMQTMRDLVKEAEGTSFCGSLDCITNNGLQALVQKMLTL